MKVTCNFFKILVVILCFTFLFNLFPPAEVYIFEQALAEETSDTIVNLDAPDGLHITHMGMF